jgi:hypothetical protein
MPPFDIGKSIAECRGHQRSSAVSAALGSASSCLGGFAPEVGAQTGANAVIDGVGGPSTGGPWLFGHQVAADGAQ